jgi:hypothetical protein
MTNFTYASVKTPEGNVLDALYKIVLMPADRVWIAATTDDFNRFILAGVNPGFVRDACARGQDIDGKCFLSLHRNDCVLHTDTDINRIVHGQISQMIAEDLAKAGCI